MTYDKIAFQSNDFKDRKLRTAAHCGAAKGQLHTLKVLHQYGASFNIENHRGDLPFHEAVQTGSFGKWLLAENVFVVLFSG